MERRSVLAGLGLSLITLVAGCSGRDGSTSQCHLNHETTTPPEDNTAVEERYAYEDLSSDAQHVVSETVANGSYATAEYDRNPPEFRYWDTATAYQISYRNETYVLLTYTGEGCEPE